MIKIGLDTSPLDSPSKARGIGKYTARLLAALRATKKVKVIEFKDSFSLAGANLIHYPYFDFFFLSLPLFKRKKTVVTIHDCTPLIFPHQYPPGIKGKIRFFIQKLALKNVSAVITDSESSKKDIIKFLGIPEGKIEIVYLAADSVYRKLAAEGGRWQAIIKKRYGLSENFILYVGDVNPNKNLPRLFAAFAKLPSHYDLVLAGKAFKNKRLPEVKRLNALIRELKLKKRVKFLGFVPDNDLVKIYNLAAVFCLSSWYEGFGLSILEAMACGCPVVTSGVSSMPEVAGEAAVLVDPNSEESIAGGIKKIIADEEFKNQLIKKGFERAKEFSWKKTAEETIKVYEKVLAK